MSQEISFAQTLINETDRSSAFHSIVVGTVKQCNTSKIRAAEEALIFNPISHEIWRLTPSQYPIWVWEWDRIGAGFCPTTGHHYRPGVCASFGQAGKQQNEWIITHLRQLTSTASSDETSKHARTFSHPCPPSLLEIISSLTQPISNFNPLELH